MIRMEIFDNQIPVFGQADDRTLNQIRVCARTADKVALMPDNHVGYGVPIGGVVAYKNAISPTGVGYDIGCGNKAVRRRYARRRSCVRDIAEDHGRRWSDHQLRHRPQERRAGRPRSVRRPGMEAEGDRPLKEMARNQLGTVGSGNHYVDIFTDEADRVWIGVHFGSRGFGHKTATHFLKAAGASDGMDVQPAFSPPTAILAPTTSRPCVWPATTPTPVVTGSAPAWPKILGAPIVEEVHNHHNYAWRKSTWRAVVGCAQGRDAGLSGPARIRRRHDGRAVGHPGRRRKRACPLFALLHRPRRGPRSWVAGRRLALSTARPARSSAPARSPGDDAHLGDRAGSNCAVLDSTSRPTATSAWMRCSRLSAPRCASCTASRRLALPWLARTSSIPTRTEELVTGLAAQSGSRSARPVDIRRIGNHLTDP